MARSPSPELRPIGGVFSVDFASTMPHAAPPSAAFAARRQDQGGFVAVPVARGWPARANALSALGGGFAAQNLLRPLAHGPALLPTGDTGYFVICPAPTGPPLSAAPRVWPEAELLECVLRPASLALAELQAHGVTHRAIRANNVFQAAPQTPVTLGCAWAAPPACHQPSWMEPPYAAMCLPAGRGDGATADDVYALGALILSLALGTCPVSDEPEDAVIRRKLAVGSYAALLGQRRLPATLAELVRGMLADDPEHRPSPALLLNPVAARARRIASRPPQIGQRALEVGAQQASTARMLAYALSREPLAGVALVRNGSMDRWLRRSLGDAVLAAQLAEAATLRDAQAKADEPLADAALVTRTVALLDPAAPLVWRSVTLWPDGLGTALDYALHAAPELVPPIMEIVSARVGRTWLERRAGDRHPAVERLEALEVRSWLMAGRVEFNALRLSYSLNPLTPCDSPLTARRWVTRLEDLLPTLEASAAGTPRGSRVLVDGHIAVFVAARRDERMDSDLNQLATAVTQDSLLSQVRLLARLQAKLLPIPVPHLAAWAADALQPLLEKFASRSRRARVAERMAEAARQGLLPTLVDLLDDPQAWQEDEDALAAAQARIVAIDTAIAGLNTASAGRLAQARRVGHDVAGGLAALACVFGTAAALLL